MSIIRNELVSKFSRQDASKSQRKAFNVHSHASWQLNFKIGWVCVALFIFWIPSVVFGATWNLDANGNWEVDINWATPSIFPNGVNEQADFGNIISANRVVTIASQNITIGNLTFNSLSNYTINQTGSRSLIFDVTAGNSQFIVNNSSGNGVHTVNVPIILNDNLIITQNSTGILTLSGAMSGTSSLTYNGPQTITRSGASTYTGSTSINSGTFNYNVGNAIPPATTANVGDGSGAAGSSNLVMNVSLTGGSAFLPNIASDGRFVQGNNRLVRISGLTGTGILSINPIVGNGFQILNGAGNTTFSGTITGGIPIPTGDPNAGSRLTKSGDSILTLTNNSPAYVGRTFIADNGTINMQTSGALGPTGNNGAVYVQNTGTLSLDGIALSIDKRLFLNGPGSGSNGALRNISGNNIYTNTIDIGWTAPSVVSANAYIGVDSGSLTLSGVVQGSQTLVKVGSNTLFLTNSANTYAGGTQVLNGTLEGNATTIKGNILNNGLTIFNQTLFGNFTNAISGTGILQKTGAANLQLSGNNTYGGATQITTGTLLAGSTTGFSPNSEHVLNNSVILNLNGFNNTIGGLTSSFSNSQVLLGPNTLTINQIVNSSFAGVITGTGNIVISGPQILTLTGPNNYSGGTLISAGSLIGDPTSLQGNIIDNAALILDQTSDGEIPFNLSGTGNFTKTGSGNLTISNNVSAFTGSAIVNQGNFILNNLLGSNLTILNGCTLSGNGAVGKDLLIDDGAFLSPGNSIGTLTVLGNYIQNSNGTYICEIASPGLNDLIDVKGTASLSGNLSIIDLNGANPDQTYLILHADGGVSGIFTFVNSSNPFMSPMLIYDPFDVFLSFKRGLVFPAKTSNQRHVATQLSTLQTPNADESQVLEGFVNLTPSQMRKGLDALAGEQYTWLNQVVRYSSERFNERIFNSVRTSLMPFSCLPKFHTIQTWLQTEGGQSYGQGDKYSQGMNSTNWNVSLGGNTAIGSHVILGVAGNFGTQTIKFYQGGKTKRNSAQGALYGVTKNNWGYFFADAVFGRAQGNYTRPIAYGTFSRKAASRPTNTSALVYGEIGKTFGGCKTLFQPFIGLEYGYYKLHTIHESGAGSVNLKIKSNQQNPLDSYFGIHLYKKNSLIQLGIDLAWQHRYNNLQVQTKNLFDGFGSDFSIKGCRLGSNAIKGNFNAIFYCSEKINFYGQVSGERWTNWSDVSANLGLGIWW